jgi:hypothetical protein
VTGDCTHPWSISQLNKTAKVCIKSHSVATESSVNRKSTSDHTHQVMMQLNAGYVRGMEVIYCIPYSIHVLFIPGNFLWKWFKMPSKINFGTKSNNWWWKKLNKFIMKEVPKL